MLGSPLVISYPRPALVLAVHREEFIILGIFSKIPEGKFRDTWVLMEESHPEFLQTGLKKAIHIP